jgi:hypothetical protein
MAEFTSALCDLHHILLAELIANKSEKARWAGVKRQAGFHLLFLSNTLPRHSFSY